MGMVFPDAATFAKSRPTLPPGVVAILLCESEIHAQASADRLIDQGITALVVVGSAKIVSPTVPIFQISHYDGPPDTHSLLNTLFDALSGRWVLWLWNGEFFVFPFGETRVLADLAAFLEDERRKVLFTYALDLYGEDLPAADVDPRECDLYFDREGYHAFPKEQNQLRVYGGLGWRFAEITPKDLHQIGRSSLIRAQAGVHLGRDMIFHDVEYGSVSCPWHHNPTGAILGLRRTRRIMAHPNFPAVRNKLIWWGSEPVAWTSAQLLEAGMIEPGQWF